MSIGEDLRSWLLADAAIAGIVGNRVHQNNVPQDTGTLPYIYYARSTQDRDQDPDLNSPSKVPHRVNWDIECISQDIDEALELADLVNAKEQYKGQFGNGSVGGIFVSSQDDGYVPRGIGDDVGWHVASIDLQTAGYSSTP
jgi:hypothetical protein